MLGLGGRIRRLPRRVGGTGTRSAGRRSCPAVDLLADSGAGPSPLPVELADYAVDYGSSPDDGCSRIIEDEVDRHDFDPGLCLDRRDGSGGALGGVVG